MKTKNIIYALVGPLMLILVCITSVLVPDLDAAMVTPSGSRAIAAGAPSVEVESGAVYEPVENPGESFYVCNCESLNVRSSPGLDGTVIAWLKPIQRVRVMEYRDEWARLSFGGWVHKGYLCP